MKTWYSIFLLLSFNWFFIQTTNAQLNVEYDYIFKLSNEDNYKLAFNPRYVYNNINLDRISLPIDSCLHIENEKFKNKLANLHPGNYLVAEGWGDSFSWETHTVLPFQFYWINNFPYTTIKLLDSKTNDVTKNAIIKMDTILIPFNNKLQAYTKASTLSEVESYKKGEMSIELDGIIYLFHDYPSSHSWAGQYSKLNRIYKRYINPVLITFPFKYVTILSHNSFTYLKKRYRTKHPKYDDEGNLVKEETRYYSWSLLLYNKNRWPFNRNNKPLIGSLTLNKTEFSQNDSLKLNAKIFVYNGKKYKKPILLEIYPLSNKAKDNERIKLKIKPTKRGEYEFTLPCKNNLSLNSTYNIELNHTNSNYSFLKSSFSISDSISTMTKFEMYANKRKRFV